jgi:hypothetical protein
VNAPIRVIVSLACDACGQSMGAGDKDQTVCKRCRERTWRRREATARLRRIHIARFAVALDGTPFRCDMTDGRFVIVHRDPETKRWRTSCFDRRGPSGHYFHTDYRAAIRSAVFEDGAELSRATFPSWCVS